MIEEFLVYVIVDIEGNEVDRFFHSDHAIEALSHYIFHSNKSYSIIHRLVTYSE